MKHFISLFIVVFASVLHGQDTLYFKNKEKQTIQLLEVNPENVKYKRWDNQAGATYTVLKSELEQVVLSNGKKETFATPAVQAVTKDSSALKTPAVTAEKPKPCDTLFFRSGKKQLVTIYDLSPTEIKYKPITNPDGPVYKALKSDIKEVVFSTGRRESFNEAPTPQYSGSPGNPAGMARKGTSDAQTFYKHRGGSIGTGIVAFIFPPAGLVPALICSNVRPKEYNLNYPDHSAWQNHDYRAAYEKQAFRMKKKRVWTGFGIGAATSILLGILLRQ